MRIRVESPADESISGPKTGLAARMLRLLVGGLLLPNLALVLIAFILVGYLWGRALWVRQVQTAHTLAHSVESYVEHAGRVMNALVLTAEGSGATALRRQIATTWRAYGFFDVIYVLDRRGVIDYLVPYENQYIGMDMSGQEYYRPAMLGDGLVISRPFISLSTGKPTVYLARALKTGGVIVGELSLGALQEAISAIGIVKAAGVFFVIDSGGRVLAHPRSELVAEQVSLGGAAALAKRQGTDFSNVVFDYKDMTFSSLTKISGVDWIVGIRSGFFEVFKPFFLVAAPVFILVLGVWAALAWTFRRKIRQLVEEPLFNLAQISSRIAAGDLCLQARVEQGEIGEVASAFNSMTANLRRRIEFENLVARLSRKCINPRDEELELMANKFLADVGRFFGADRSYIFLFSDNGETISNTHEWCAKGIEPQIDMLQDIPLANHSWSIERLKKNESVHLPDIKDLPPEACLLRELLEAQSIRSLILTPLFFGREVRGFIGFDLVKNQRAFSEQEQRGLRVVSEILSSLMDRSWGERALLEGEKRFRTVVNASKDAMISVGADRKISIFNPAAEMMFGFSRKEAMGREGGILLPPEERERYSNFLKRFFNQGVSSADIDRIFEMSAMRKDGTVFPVEISLSGGEYGGEPFVLILARDVTERKRAETELADLNRHLEMLVYERTRDLAKKADELEAANKKLMVLDEMKSSFLSSVSHELRTPLTSVLGFVKLIHRDFDKVFSPMLGTGNAAARKGERVLRNLLIIEQEGERLTRMINDFLDLSKIESGRLEWKDRPVKPVEVIRKSVAAVSGLFDNKPDVELIADIPGDLPLIMVDPDRMAQVLTNLLNNAAKFTSHGRVWIDAEAGWDGFLNIRVRDTGEGIPEADQGKIFDRFHQASHGDTLGGKPQGTGLGLAICNQIVSHYGGRIRVKSEFGRGSVFTVALPIHDFRTAASAVRV